MDKVLESNKLIAEFMGAKYDKDTKFPMHKDDLWIPMHGICNYTTVDSGRGKILEYHKSWDWLKPVIDKIGNIPEAGYVFKRSLDGGLFYTIDTVWNACVAFIEWYNTHNK